MNFLVIVAALLINHYWTRDRVLPGDLWFGRLLQFINRQTQRFEQDSIDHWRSILALFLPALLLLCLLWAVEGVWLGFISFCIHVALLLTLFDPQPLREWVQRYLLLWRAENYEGAYLALQERFPVRTSDGDDDPREVHAHCIRFLLTNSFERLFAVLFWYLVLGPIGALVYYAVVQLREVRYQTNSFSAAQYWLERLEFVLEWVPVRLLGLTFALAGQFEDTFNCLRHFATDVGSSAMRVLFACACAAIGRAQGAKVAQEFDSEHSISTLVIDLEDGADAISSSQTAQQIENLLNLLERSQIIWVSALALLAVYGIGE